MVTSTVEYLGELRTKCSHTFSGTEIYTDAPLDNKGKAETFSPTDLVATSLASCMFTIMGIYCNEHGLTLKSAKASVVKIMASNPRRIQKIEVQIDLYDNDWSETERKKVIAAGRACPVAKTLEGNVEIEFIFI